MIFNRYLVVGWVLTHFGVQDWLYHKHDILMIFMSTIYLNVLYVYGFQSLMINS